MPRRLEPIRAATVSADDTFIVPIELTRSTHEETGEPSDAKIETKVLDFEVWGTAPGDATMVMTKMGRVTKDGEAVIDGSGMSEFMDFALTPDSAKMWREMVSDQEWRVPASVIGDAVAKIQEEWAARPTTPSGRS